MGAQLTKGERTRHKILAVAKVLFLSQGYTATSMRQIAQAVGITPAAIYNYFSGKEEIFNFLLEEAAPITSILSLFDMVEADDPKTCIEDTFFRMIDLFSRHDDYLQLALIDAQERNGATLRKFLPQLIPAGLSYYQRLPKRSPDKYQLRDLSPFLFMRALISMIGGYVMSKRVVGSVGSPQLPNIDWARGMADIFLHGVLELREQGGS
jgi:AcrR family transcriptional regulator